MTRSDTEFRRATILAQAQALVDKAARAARRANEGFNRAAGEMAALDADLSDRVYSASGRIDLARADAVAAMTALLRR